MDTELLAQRVSLGDELGTPREVEHFAVFRRHAKATAAAEELKGLGFRTDMSKSGFKTTVVARIDRDVLPDTVDSTVSTVFDVVAAHGGVYDGWGGPVVVAS